MKIFISAHELSPIQGSECRSAWNILTRLSFMHELTIFCAETNQFKTSDYKHQVETHIDSFHKSTKLIFIKQPLITIFISQINKLIFGWQSNIGNNILYFLGVRFWEKNLYKYIKKNYKKSELPNLIHHFNHISFREPGYCWKLDIPFIWGPVSGMVSPPKNFISSLDSSLKKKIQFRYFINYLQSHYGLRIKQASKKSSHIFCVGSDDYNFFKQNTRKISYMSDMGTNPRKNIIDRDKNKKITISLIGRLDPLKAPQIALDCFSESKKIRDNANLQIIGEGPLMDELRNKYSGILGSSVQWTGKILYDEVKMKLSNTDLLIHTSIKEAGSAVVLEALEQSVPVICHDAFGLAHTINEKCGIKIKMSSEQESVEGFKRSIEFLIDNPDIIESLRNGAHIRSQELSWSKMVDEISSKYYEVTSL